MYYPRLELIFWSERLVLQSGANTKRQKFLDAEQMEQDRRNLPSFKSLTVVSAVVRHRSFTGASRELHVTPSAVSKQVALIEVSLGLSLFDRHGGLALPRPEARQLAKAIDSANGILLDAVASIRPKPAQGDLRIAAPATFAMRWLIPRLWTFSSRYPAVSVDVIHTHARDDLASIDYDVAIRHGPPFPPDTYVRQVMSDTLGLVMTPTLLRSRRPRLADLSRIPFLESDSRPGELDSWLDQFETKPQLKGKRRSFPHFYIALEAALSGEGALVAPTVTIADLIARGLLCEPFQQSRIDACHIVAFAARGRSSDGDTTAFLNWLEGSASQPI
jgi:DNA-binding transcriptional LysR family regulator